MGYFRELAGLRPSDRVLEIGCGIGRMARALVPILRPPGSYDGFDVVERGISWCRTHYRDAPAPFRFVHVDLYNPVYNPNGVHAARDFVFPYPDQSFDLVLATSVFTHLFAETADRYLAETARVIAPGGRVFSTWFLLSGERNVSPPAPFRRLDATLPTAIADPTTPESAVAYDEDWVRQCVRDHDLRLRAIYHGSWASGSGTAHQDLVIAERG